MKVKFSKLFTAVAALSTAFVSSMNFCFAMENHPLDFNSPNSVLEKMAEMHDEPALKGIIMLLDVTKNRWSVKELFDVQIPESVIKDFHDSDCSWKHPGDNCSCGVYDEDTGYQSAKVLVGPCATPYVKDIRVIRVMDGKEKDDYLELLVKKLFTNPKEDNCWGVREDLAYGDNDVRWLGATDIPETWQFVKPCPCEHDKVSDAYAEKLHDFDGHAYYLWIEPTGGKEASKFFSYRGANREPLLLTVTFLQQAINHCYDCEPTNKMEFIPTKDLFTYEIESIPPVDLLK